MFATAIHFHPSLIFAGKARSLPLEWYAPGACAVKLFTVVMNTAVLTRKCSIRVGLQILDEVNGRDKHTSLQYFRNKSFVEQAPVFNWSKVKWLFQLIYSKNLNKIQTSKTHADWVFLTDRKTIIIVF